LNVTVNSLQTPTFAFGNTLTICQGEAVPSLPTSSNNAISGTWSPAVVSATSSGSYLFTPNAGQCSNPFTLNVTVNPLPQFTITHGCVESDYVIGVNSDQSNLTYTWFNFSGDNLGNQSTLIVDEVGDYTVIVSLGNCSLDSSVYLSNVYCEIPKGISPNNDGLNDFFELSNLNVRNLKIFNRYGVEVYSKENYTNQWNGKCSKGNELPDATYYYVIEFNSGNSKTGWVYINR
jgi:gliding motility-associated-like protein